MYTFFSTDAQENKKPTTRQKSTPSRQKKAVCFTEEEERLFQRRYENGYNLKHDQRFNEWISLNYPYDSSEDVPVIQKPQSKRQADKNTS